ncbi:MAG: hypothetical protein K0S47_788 [Herbinix sp.]|jgi:lipopolysaccharide cholinephosphotransferase|nr:hypothetical protein [Herbinix sp.]
MGKIKKWLKTKGAILEYGDFYNSYREETIYLLKQFYKRGWKVAIWGAGLKGTAFLNCIDSKGEYIKAVVDMNKELLGKYLTKHHKIISFEEVLEFNPDVIVIMNSAHYADNYALLREKGYLGELIDLDYMIENKVDPDAILEGKSFIIKNVENYDLNKIQVQILDILKEIDRICKLHNITYFLSAGTALGAMRHQGFVPWDDDADIGMLREDFERFRKIVENELGENFYYQRMKRSNDFYRPFDQVGKKNTSFVLYNVKDLRIRHGIHVDVFPFDVVSADEKRREEHVREVQDYRTKIFQKRVPHVVATKNIYRKFVINHEYYLKKFIPYHYLNNKMKRALNRYTLTEDVYVADLLTHYKKIMYFKKSDLFPVKYVEFENIQLPVPNNCDSYLKMMYGDYMTPPPEGKRNQRHRLVELSYDKAYDKDKNFFKE